MKPWNDPQWAERPAVAMQIGLATFGILALELALIRWTSGQIRIFAYFSNLVLIAAFLGMGLGVALGARRPVLVHFTLPALALLSLVLAFSEQLGLMHLVFPDRAVSLWGSELGDGLRRAAGLPIFLLLVAAIVGIFVLAGSAVGQLFSRLPVLRSYSADLIGSLAGILAMTLATQAGAGPPIWLLLGALPFALLSRTALSWASCALVVLLGFVSVGGAIFSPYNRIDLEEDGTSIRLSVNRDFHQHMHDLSDTRLRALASDPEAWKKATWTRLSYDLPFLVNDQRGAALIVGAGTGNDVQAALRAGYKSVQSVEIDPAIIALGQARHPEHPYSDPRVVPVVMDARAFLERYQGEPFDVICYGLLDSHAMFGSLSTLRLDNYVYTEEALRSAWRHVSPKGHLSVSFSIFAGPWISDRLYWTITRATGHEPVVIHHGWNFGATYLVAREPGSLQLGQVSTLPRLAPSQPLAEVETTSDDWPFLYIRPGLFPWGYVLVLSALLAFAAWATPRAFGREALGRDFHPALFLMGAAFMLIETRGVTACSLLFGSTWQVNSAIFAGVLLLVLAANVAVNTLGLSNLWPWAGALIASVVLVYLVEPGTLAGLPWWARGTLGSLINGLPVGFAGVLVSVLLSRASNPSPALGSNLLGSVVGGALEYLSMVLGLRALALLALVLYLGALLLLLREEKRAGAAAAPRAA